MTRKTSLVLMGLVLIASAGTAQVTFSPDDKVVVELEATPMGAQKFDAFGVAAKITENDIQMFVTKVGARCKDGTILVVHGYNKDGEDFDIGTIKMLLGSGSLTLKSSIDSSRVFPLRKLKAVTVHHKDGIILKGVFER